MRFVQAKLQQASYNRIALLLGITVSILVEYASSPATASGWYTCTRMAPPRQRLNCLAVNGDDDC